MLNYSPLCDVSYSAYIAYLAANIGDSDKHDVFISVFRGEGGREFDGRCIDVGGDVGALDGGSHGSVAVDALVGVCDIGSQGCIDGHDDSGVDNTCGRVASIEGCSGDISGGGGIVAVGSGGDGLFRETTQPVLDVVSAIRGKWARSNKRKKEKRKSAKLAAGSGFADLNGGGVDSVVGDDVGVVTNGSEDSVPVVEVGAARGSGSEFARADLEAVVTDSERRALARQWYERKKVENELAIQRARYNVKRNSYLDRAKISEKKWEQERLSCEQKLAKITEARFGCKPGYAEALASISDGSEIPPSLSTGSDSPANLSDGTISPNSSMSVAEANRLIRKVEELSGEVAQLKLEKIALSAAREFSGGSAIVEDGKVHVFDGSGQYVPPSLSGASQPSICPSDFGF